MSWRRVFTLLLWLLAVVAGLTLIVAANYIRSPALLALRPWPWVLLLAMSFAFIACAWALSRKSPRAARIAILSLGICAVGLGAWREARIAALKSAVLSTPPAALQELARHLIVGYGAIEELEPLIVRASVAGVFIARRNAHDRSEAQLASDIRHFQGLRRANGLPPLWIATDMEGGLVSALSPPLRRPLPLSSLVHSGELVVNEADSVARDLACVGVNLNFAPVVDRNYRIIEPGDRFSQISRRAISSDERVIALTARDYCRALAETGVQCTLKHFPGIGAVKGDTHLRRAALPELRDDDLFPFRELTREHSPWIMLSHINVENLDAERPASASRKVIGILRDDWNFNGVLVTDDVSMQAYAENFEQNVIDTLRNGADLLLVSYNPDLVYVALDALLRARHNDAALARALADSDERLAARPPLTPSCNRLAAR